MSPQEWSSQAGLDYEKNQGEIEEHEAAGRTYNPGQAPPSPFGLAGMGGMGGGGDSNDPNDDDNDDGKTPSPRKSSDAANRMAAMREQLESAASVEEALRLCRELAETIGG